MTWPSWGKSWGKSWGASWGYSDGAIEQVQEDLIFAHANIRQKRRIKKVAAIEIKLKRSMKDREKEFPVIL